MMTNTDVATVEELAALDFEPWQHVTDEWTPPPNDEWAKMMAGQIVSVRLAWRTMYKSKAELMDMFEALDDSEAEEFVKKLANSADFFLGLHEFLHSAEIRLMCAAAAASLQYQAP